MIASLILSIAFVGQGAEPAGPQTPAAKSTSNSTKPDFRSTIQSTIDKKKAAQARKTKTRIARRMQEQAATKSRREQAERMAPVVAAQQREDFRVQAETQALQQMSSAMMQNAATNQLRYRLQSQQAGVPQVLVPGQGFAPYPGGIAAPYAPPVIVVP